MKCTVNETFLDIVNISSLVDSIGVVDRQKQFTLVTTTLSNASVDSPMSSSETFSCLLMQVVSDNALPKSINDSLDSPR